VRPVPYRRLGDRHLARRLGRLLTRASGSDRSIRSVGPQVEIGARVRQIRRSFRPCVVDRRGPAGRPTRRTASGDVPAQTTWHQDGVPYAPFGNDSRKGPFYGRLASVVLTSAIPVICNVERRPHRPRRDLPSRLPWETDVHVEQLKQGIATLNDSK
jgi:hypothetical protein